MHNILSTFFQKKKQSWYHILSASLIIIYWWGLWNILDFLFLGAELSLHKLVTLITIDLISITALIFLDFDLSEL
ncbi:MAG: hypothetical protein WC753_00565 [Candidatus Gracilibacteria bacterium]|jgi:hypothetical protein